MLLGSIAALVVSTLSSPDASAQAFTFAPGALTATEDFDDMLPTGTAFSPGWISTDTTMVVTDGSIPSGSTAFSGGIYNAGTTGATDRAFASAGSGSTIPRFGASFLNGTGTFIGSFSLGGFMEQWRSGNNALIERLVFEFSFTATGVAVAPGDTWTALPSFDLVEPATATNDNVALNGNDPANRTAIAASATVAWPAGATMWIRWSDTNDTGNDGLYGIDDFSMTVVTTAPPKNLIFNPPSSLWDLEPLNQNWLDGAAPAAFTTGDNVNFTQSGIPGGSATVTVAAAGLAPGNINVSATSGTYTLTGGALSGTGVLTKTGGSTLELATTYSNAVLVNGGILKTMASDRISDTAAVTVGEGATFDVNGNLETIGALTLTGGTVATGPGLLTLGSTVTTNASTVSAVIGGFVDVGGVARTYAIADGGAAIDLRIDAALSGGGRITLAGPGTLALNGDNSAISNGFTLPATANVSIGTATALGGGVLFFNGGTVAASVPLLGGNAVTTSVSLGGNVKVTGADVEWTGGWTVFGTGAQNRTITIDNVLTFGGDLVGSDDTVNLAGAGSVEIASPATVLGTLNLSLDTLVTGSITGAVVVTSGVLSGSGNVGSLTLRSGATLAPGDGLGTLTGTAFTWDGGGLILAELGSGNASDTFDIGTGVLTRGAAGLYQFDFGGTGEAGNLYTLLSFGSLDPLATFAGSDFSYLNLAPGVEGNFVLTANELTFVTVPESGVFGSLLAGVATVLCCRPRRAVRRVAQWSGEA